MCCMLISVHLQDVNQFEWCLCNNLLRIQDNVCTFGDLSKRKRCSFKIDKQRNTGLRKLTLALQFSSVAEQVALQKAQDAEQKQPTCTVRLLQPSHSMWPSLTLTHCTKQILDSAFQKTMHTLCMGAQACSDIDTAMRSKAILTQLMEQSLIYW